SLPPSRAPCHRSLLAPTLFFTDPAATEIYPLSLHDALPISDGSGAVAKPSRQLQLNRGQERAIGDRNQDGQRHRDRRRRAWHRRSEEHTSELQSLTNLVCRLLLEKKKPDTHSASPFRSPSSA